MSDYIWIALGVLAFIGLFAWKRRKQNAPTKATAPWVISQGTGKLTLQDGGLGAGRACCAGVRRIRVLAGRTQAEEGPLPETPHETLARLNLKIIQGATP